MTDAAREATAPAAVGVARRVEGLVRASHPAPTVVVTAIAATLAAGAGASPARAALAAAAVLAGQLSIGWSNDWLDADRDVAVGRTSKPVVQGLVTARTLRRAALLAALACAALSFATGVLPGLVHVVAVASGWSYNHPLKRTAWSFVPYTVSFALLPVFLVTVQPGARPAWWAVVTGGLLGAGAHVANVLPDLDDDAATGVRGLPHRLGRRASSVLAPALLVAAVLVVVLAPGQRSPAPLVAAGTAVVLAVTAGALGATRPTSRLPFRLTMAVAALCVGLLLAAGSRMVVT
ncbi:UbiA family prenyltransferase [Actinotalea solisilvae]|uniref:UbiA family prenyltransferase n=1 Tax=Actinotalea solisilvae TaxID=2072922 RepID=UPI0027DC02DF|nr:UbiA family prenyltransferase [Actinotalea solisilvae]